MYTRCILRTNCIPIFIPLNITARPFCFFREAEMCLPRDFREIFEASHLRHIFDFARFAVAALLTDRRQLVDVEITFERFNLETIGGGGT